jgi:hypothetical protein
MTAPASHAISVYDAAFRWFGYDPHQRIGGYGEFDWIILLTRDRELRDIACAILSEIAGGTLKSVRRSWLSGIPPSWMEKLGKMPGDLDPRRTTTTLGSLVEFANRRGEIPIFFADVVIESAPNPATHSGAVGRPTSMHLIADNMRERAKCGELASKLSEETGHQSAWLRQTYPSHRPVTPKAIGNSLRSLFKSLKGDVATPKNKI